jgi:hypothetical protein
MAINHIKPRFD